jgi:hypothetical protein
VWCKLSEQYYNVVGVDPSSRSLAVVVLGPSPTWAIRRLPDDEITRVSQANYWFGWYIQQLVKAAPTYVFIEKPVMAIGGPGSTIPQAEIQGALIAASVSVGAQYVEKVNVKQWKKSICGNGNAPKILVMEHVKNSWPKDYAEYEVKAKSMSFSVKQQNLLLSDLADARAIAEYGQQFVITNGMV